MLLRVGQKERWDPGPPRRTEEGRLGGGMWGPPPACGSPPGPGEERWGRGRDGAPTLPAEAACGGGPGRHLGWSRARGLPSGRPLAGLLAPWASEFILKLEGPDPGGGNGNFPPQAGSQAGKASDRSKAATSPSPLLKGAKKNKEAGQREGGFREVFKKWCRTPGGDRKGEV